MWIKDFKCPVCFLALCIPILGDTEKRKKHMGGHSEWPTIGFGCEQIANHYVPLSKGGLQSKCYFQDINITAVYVRWTKTARNWSQEDQLKDLIQSDTFVLHPHYRKANLLVSRQIPERKSMQRKTSRLGNSIKSN